MAIDFDLEVMPERIGLAKRFSAQAEHSSHLVLIPSFNSGRKLAETVAAARAYWAPVWVVIDGSTDDSTIAVRRLAADDPQIRLFVLPHNQGKGAAILHGLRHAAREGFSHALTMDADGQHPVALIPRFVRASVANPNAIILGKPVFDETAPRIRVLGRKLSNWWTDLEVLWTERFDSLFGFRVYPVDGLLRVMEKTRWMRRFDFDTEAAVRLCWNGFRPINLPAPVRYLTPSEGGVSHFRYVRDNILLSWMHLRLVASFIRHFPAIMARRLRSSRH